MSFPYIYSLSILVFFLTSSFSWAAPVCRNIFLNNDAALKIVIDDPFIQWIRWEQKANIKIFQQSSEQVKIPVSKVKTDSLSIDLYEHTPEAIRENLITGDLTRWYKHPFNQTDTVPHFADPVVAYRGAYLTASRSLAVKFATDYYTIKMGTSHPHGPKGAEQLKKIPMNEDIQVGRNRMSYIEKVHREIGPDPDLLLALDVAIVADRATHQGYMIRNMSFLKSGNYYLPAFSLPYIGREISFLNDVAPEKFWQKHFAESLGKAKAKLLLRYGLQMETPNTQNILIELGAFLKPTGRIVLRDLSDTQFVMFPAASMGAADAIAKDYALGLDPTRTIKPYWKNSAWRLDESGEKSFSPATLDSWGKAHDNAYKAELEKELNIDLSKFATTKSDGTYQTLDKNPELDRLMSSGYISDRFKAYREKLNKEAGFTPPPDELSF